MMRRFELRTILIAAICATLQASLFAQVIVPALPEEATGTTQGLTAEYYRIETSWAHAWTRNEKSIFFETTNAQVGSRLAGSLQIGQGTKIRWSGYITAPAAGYYRFSLGAPLAPYAWSGYPDAAMPNGWTAPGVSFSGSNNCSVSIGSTLYSGSYSGRLNRLITDPIWFNEGEIKSIQVNAESTASEPFTCSLEWQHPGSFGNSTYEVIDPAYLSPALQRNKWICQDYTAISTGSGKVRCYWRKLSGAYGYRVYGGTTEQFSRETPLTNGTVVSPDSGPGSQFATYIQTGLTNGNIYYYMVKPAFANPVTGMDTLGNESLLDSDSPSTIAIPWDYPIDSGYTARNNAILNAIKVGYGITVSQFNDRLTVRGPDYLVYSSTSSPTYDTTYTDSNTQRMIDDATETPVAGDIEADADTGPNLTTLPAHRGPYFRVRSTSGFIGVSAAFTLPTPKAGYLYGSRLAYPDTEALCLMLGSGIGNGTGVGLAKEVDAGYYFSKRKTLSGPQQVWSAYVLGAQQGSNSNFFFNSFFLSPTVFTPTSLISIQWRIRPKDAFSLQTQNRNL